MRRCASRPTSRPCARSATPGRKGPGCDAGHSTTGPRESPARLRESVGPPRPRHPSGASLAKRSPRQNGSSVTGSLLELPFPDNHFDVVIASQVTHHLGDEAEVVQHFREAWRVTREGLLLNDLHRNPALYGLVWLSVRMAGLSAAMRNDALVSVRCGWWIKEWRELAAQAGIPDARVWLYFGSRIILQARKDFASAPA